MSAASITRAVIPHSARFTAGEYTESCSMPLMMISGAPEERLFFAFRTEVMTILLDSEPPDVKKSSCGEQPAHSDSSSLVLFSCLFASLPTLCMEEGLP